MTTPRVFELLDQKALNTLAHPLRMRLLAMLRTEGPATATRLAGCRLAS